MDIRDLARSLYSDDEETSPLTDYSNLSVPDLLRAKAQEYGVPEGLALALAHQESGGRQSATSYKGARGIMQLMPGTAKMLGVDMNDPVQNVDGGMRYLKQLHDEFGDWKLALAGYHAGPGAVRKAGGIPATSDGLSKTGDYVNNIVSRWQRLGGEIVATPEAREKSVGRPNVDLRDIANQLYTVQTEESIASDEATASGGISPSRRIDPFASAFAGAAQSERDDLNFKDTRALQFSTGVARMISEGAAFINALGGNGSEWLKGVEESMGSKAEEMDRLLAADPEIARAMQENAQASGFWGKLQAVIDNPEIAADMIMRSSGSILLGLPLMAAGAPLGAAAGAAIGATRLAQIAGATTAGAARIGQIVGASAGQMVSGGVTAGGNAFSNIKKDLIEQGVDPETAERLAIKEGITVGLAVGALESVGSTQALVRSLTGQMRGAGFKVAAREYGKDVVLDAGSEGLQEVFQLGRETAAKEAAGVDPGNPDYGGTLALGAVAGAGTTAVVGTPGLIQGALSKPDPTIEQGAPGQTAPQAEPVENPTAAIKTDTRAELGAVYSRLDSATNGDEAVALFAESMSNGTTVTAPGGVDIAEMETVQQLRALKETQALRDVMAKMEPEARTALLNDLNNATSENPNLPAKTRLEAGERAAAVLSQAGAIESAQAEINAKKLEGTVDDKAAIASANEAVNVPQVRQALANADETVRSGITAQMAIVNNARLPEADRAKAAAAIVKWAQAQQPAAAEGAKSKPQTSAKAVATSQAPALLAEAQTQLQAVTQTPEWKAKLAAMKPAEKKAMLERLAQVSNSKLSAPLRLARAQAILAEAGIPASTGATAQTAEAPAQAKPRITTQDARALISKAATDPIKGTFVLTDIATIAPTNTQPNQITRAHARFLQVVARAFGRDVQFFTQEGGTGTTDGFVVNENPNVLFLNVNQSGSASALAVMMHELFHSMPADIREAFINAVKPLIPANKHAALQEYVSQPELGLTQAFWEEVGADLFATGFSNAQWVGEVLNNMPVSAATKLMNYIRQFIAKVEAAFGRFAPFATANYMSDVNAMKEAWQTAFRDYLNRVNTGQGMIAGRPASGFSIDELAELMEGKDNPAVQEQAEAEYDRRMNDPETQTAIDRFEAEGGRAEGVTPPNATVEAAPANEQEAEQQAKQQEKDETALQKELKKIKGKKKKGQAISNREADLEAKLEEAAAKQAEAVQEPEVIGDPDEDGYEINEDMPLRYSKARAEPLNQAVKRERPEEMSTRVPSVKTPVENAVTDFITIGLEAMQADPRAFEANVNLVRAYPVMRDNEGMTTEQAAEAFVQQARETLIWLHNQFDPNLRQRAKLWYDGARAIADRWSRAYGLNDEQIAGAIAVLSPQKDWFQNVSLAKRVVEAMGTKQNFAWSPEMEQVGTRIYKSEKNQLLLNAIRGKTLSQLDHPFEKAAWIRAYDEAHNDRRFPIISPEGDDVSMAKTKKGKDGKAAWSSLNAIAKAVSVIEDSSPENISGQLGRQHKVRNFYNNILVPNSKNGHVTIDTHAVAAALMTPLSGNSTEVSHNFGGGGSAKAGAYGANGTYGLYAEAYRQAAEAVGVSPREMQSITWEAVRGLFRPEFKRDKNALAEVQSVWSAYRNGEIEHEQALERISAIAGGIDTPSWARSDGIVDEEAGDSTNEAELAGDELPGGSAKPATRRGRGRNAGSPEAGVKNSAARVLFEVAPDPNDAPLTSAWNQLANEQKAIISERIAQALAPKVLRAAGVKGEMKPQLGGWMGDTNPSFSIVLADNSTPAQVERAAKLMGYALRQEGMMVMTPKEFAGTERNGLITINLPKDASPELVSDVYNRIYDLDKDALIGHTTVDGQMAIALPMDKADDLAEKISARLNREYMVDVDTIYSAWITKENYGYDSQKTSTGAQATGQSPLRAAANRLRAEADSLFRGELDAAGIDLSAVFGDGRSGMDGEGPGPDRQTSRSTTRIPSFGRPQEDAVSAEGVHFSWQQRPSLETNAYGTGIKGAEAERLRTAKDPRIKKRTYFYVNLSQGVFPEQGLGPVAHVVNLTNLYDMDADRLSLYQADKNAMESAILDAGYDGYLSRTAFGRQGVAIVMGPNKRIPVAPFDNATERSAVPAAPNYTLEKQAKLDFIGDPRLPAGMIRASRLQQLAPDLYEKLDAQGVIAAMGDQPMYKDDIAKLFPSGQKYSTQRGAILSPEFREWFGDSKVVLDNGEPKVMYHGTAQDITAFRAKQAGAIFVTPNPRFADMFADSSENWMQNRWYEVLTKEQGEQALIGAFNAIRADYPGKDKTSKAEVARLEREAQEDWMMGYMRNDYFRAAVADMMPSRANIMPLYVRAENPFDFDNPLHRNMLIDRIEDESTYDDLALRDMLREGEWELIEQDYVQAAIKEIGHDSFYVKEGGNKNLAVYSPTQLKSVTGNDGSYSLTNPDIRRSTARGNLPTSFVTPEMTRMDNVIYALQNKHVDTKRVQAAIEAAGGDIRDDIDIELGEELYHSRASKRVKEFLNDEMKPLLAALKMANKNIVDFNEFLHFRHADERNREIARINPDMPDGGSGLTNAQIGAYFASLNPRDQQTFESLARRIDAITRNSRQLMVDYGLESQDTIDTWERTYPSYVPLMREEIPREQLGVGRGFSVSGGMTRRAMGSDKPVADILAHIAMMREKVIAKGEGNRVALAAIGLATENPNADFWMPVVPGRDEDTQRETLAAMGIDPDLVDNLMDQPQQRFIDPRTGMVRSMVDNNLGNQPNVLAARVNGKNVYLVFAPENERAMRMAAAMKNADADKLGLISSNVAKVTQYFAKINTQWNPVFGFLNAMRDTGSAMLNLQSTDLAGKQKEVFSGVFPAIGGIVRSLRKERQGQRINGTWENLWEEFQREGGTTGYRDMFITSEDRAKAIQAELDAMSDGKAKKSLKYMGNLLSDFNETMENAVRLAAYKAAKDSGMTNARAAQLAKNLTVNFNKRGQMGTQIGAWYAFFNAAMQGTARLKDTMFEKGTWRLSKTGQMILAGASMVGVAQALMLAGADLDDEIPEFVKDRNFVIPVGGGKYVAIPLPLGFNVIPAVMRKGTEFVLRGGRDPLKFIGGTIDVIADGFNPIGNAGLSLQTLAPTIADPIAALAENKDWTGKAISKEARSSLDAGPGFTRNFSSATAAGIMIAQGINRLTGGNDYSAGLVSPTGNQIDYLAAQVAGGVGREVSKVFRTGAALVTGDELPPNRIPLAGRFVGTVNGTGPTRDKFYENVKELNDLQRESKARRESREGYAEFMRDNPKAKLATYADQVEREITSLRKMRQSLMDRNAPKERIASIDQRITAQMDRLNQRMEQYR